MTESARVQSVDAVKAMSAALRAFEENAVAALTDLDLQVNRILEWIAHDRRDYWGLRLRRDSERLSEARINLQRRRVIAGGDDLGNSCHDEQKLVDLAKRRVELAETKSQAVHHWTHTIRRELIEFRSTINQLASFLQVEVPRAKALLERMIRALELYLTLEAMQQAAPPPDWGSLLVETGGAGGQTDPTESATAASAAAEPQISPPPAALNAPADGILAQNCGADQADQEQKPGQAPAPQDREA